MEMPKKPKYPLAAQTLVLPRALTVKQAERAGLMAAHQVVTVALRECDDGDTYIEVRGVNADESRMDPETLFRSWLLFAQLIGQMGDMPMEQRRLAMQTIHLWQNHTAPVPVNQGYPS